MVFGFAALFWAERHWSRWPASIAVAGGTGLLACGALVVQRDVTGTASILVGTMTATALAAAAVWVLAFRSAAVEPPAGGGPPDEPAGKVAPRPPSLVG